MGAFFRQISLLIGLAGFVSSLVQVAEYWEYDIEAPDVHTMLAQRVNATSLTQSLNTALEEQNYRQARTLLHLGKHYQHAIDYAYYQQYLKTHDTTTHRLSRQVTGFAEGFISGTGEDASGVTGALVADFTVVGDVRDLNEQYVRYQQGLPVNQLITTLAGIGVSLTAASVGSLGAAAPAKAGVSTLKLATRMNRLSRSFRDELGVMAGKVFDWQQFLSQAKRVNLAQIPQVAKQSYHPRAAQKIMRLAEQANDIRKNTSISDSVYLIQYLETSADLGRLHRVSQQFGVHTRGVFRLLGKAAVRGVKVLRLTVELLISLLSTACFALLFIFSIGRDTASS